MPTPNLYYWETARILLTKLQRGKRFILLCGQLYLKQLLTLHFCCIIFIINGLDEVVVMIKISILFVPLYFVISVSGFWFTGLSACEWGTSEYNMMEIYKHWGHSQWVLSLLFVVAGRVWVMWPCSSCDTVRLIWELCDLILEELHHHICLWPLGEICLATCLNHLSQFGRVGDAVLGNNFLLSFVHPIKHHIIVGSIMEWNLAWCEFPHCHSHAVHICFGVVCVASHKQFWWKPPQWSFWLCSFSMWWWCCFDHCFHLDLGQSKVCEFGMQLIIQQHIRTLDVSVQDPCLVKMWHSTCNLQCNLFSLWPTQLFTGLQQVEQVTSGHQLHHNAEWWLIHACSKACDDVWWWHCRHCLHFIVELFQ